MTNFGIIQNGREARIENDGTTITVVCGFRDKNTSEFLPSHSVKPRSFKTERGAVAFANRFVSEAMFAPERI